MLVALTPTTLRMLASLFLRAIAARNLAAFFDAALSLARFAPAVLSTPRRHGVLVTAPCMPRRLATSLARRRVVAVIAVLSSANVHLRSPITMARSSRAAARLAAMARGGGGDGGQRDVVHVHVQGDGRRQTGDKSIECS